MKSGIWAMLTRNGSWTNCERQVHLVVVVRGNCDSNFEWPVMVDLGRGGKNFVQHIPPERPPDNVDAVLHRPTPVLRNESAVAFGFESGLRAPTMAGGCGRVPHFRFSIFSLPVGGGA
jgi:hypothetical protein